MRQNGQIIGQRSFALKVIIYAALFTNYGRQKKEKSKDQKTIQVITKISLTIRIFIYTITTQSSSYCVHVTDFQKLPEKTIINQ